MTRVYRPESGSKIRRRLLRNMSTALNRAKEDGVSEAEKWDIFAFILLCLESIEESVEQTASAWENRGYWVKADQFRLDWEWVSTNKDRAGKCLAANDLEGALAVLPGLAQPLSGHQPYKKGAKDKPWRGSWQSYSGAQ